jgi:hypothetical protein
MNRNADTLEQFIADLTPAEREAIATATPEDWAKAAADAATDPKFWADLGVAIVTGFLQGFARGLDDR